MNARELFPGYHTLFAENLRRKEYWLTPAEQQAIDPTGKFLAKALAMHSCTAYSPQPPNPLWSRRTSSDWLEWLQGVLLGAGAGFAEKYPQIFCYELDMARKFCPQGGPIPWTVTSANLEELYANADRPVYVRESVRLAIDLLTRQITELVDRYGYPQVQPYTGFSSEASGSPWGTQKAYWQTYHDACWWAEQGVYPLPDILGSRYYRGKPRTIHEDSFGNVLAIGPQLGARRTWLKTHLPELFGSWLAPWISDQPRITDRICKGWHWYGFDYKACDLHYTVDLMEKTVFPLWRALTPDKMEWDFEADFYRKMFWEPIYMGNYLSVGKHTLMNGTSINNDIETMTDVVIALAVGLELEYPSRYFDVHALGDDVGLHVHPSLRDPRGLYQAIAEELGMVVEKEKCFFLPRAARYLRRTYEPGGLTYDPLCTGKPVYVGAYPLTMTLNTLIHPEWVVGSLEQNVVASLQRCDNAWGHPLWRNFVDQFWSMRSVTALDWDKVSSTLPYKDWFAKLYGESWSLGSSPTFQALIDNKQF
jgi:hypothetical protein